jgi:hypothetical protein
MSSIDIYGKSTSTREASCTTEYAVSPKTLVDRAGPSLAAGTTGLVPKAARLEGIYKTYFNCAWTSLRHILFQEPWRDLEGAKTFDV